MRWRALGTVGLILDFTICGFARLVTVPTIPFADNNGTYALSQLTKIVVDARHASTVDTQGQTLIPPTLKEFAATFQEDLRSSLGIDLPLITSSTSSDHAIFLTLSNSTDFRDVAGRFIAEAYALLIDNHGITISGASPLGVWWGTRSLIQAAVVSKHNLPQGSAIDAPGWGTRGVMLDAGRHYYPPDFLIEMCSYLSFFKQNVFHLHLSDNLYNNVDLYSTQESLDLYAAFRPWSDDPALSGLNKRANESYTRSQFDHIQRQCVRRGVTIIPEIEAPGHALAIVQWRPELGLTDLSMLNISHPDTIPTMKTIWKIFLPWFHSKTVHLGADEYSSSYVSDYTNFVNDMHTYIAEQSDKNTRIWGTFTPSQGANVSKAVTIQHWEFYEDNPYFDYIKNNYSVLNSDDAFYIVGKWSGSYPQYLNKTRVFHGDPSNNGPYAPNIFSTTNATDNPPRDNPYVLGHIAALWNDYGPNATTYLEAYYSWRDVLPALADKQWGGDILEDEYDDVFDTLHAVIPGQNLDRHVPSKTDLILHYNFANTTGTTVPDLSGNNYHATFNHSCPINTSNSTIRFTESCTLTTPIQSKGRDYTLSFSVYPSTTHPSPLFSGRDSTLLNGNGSISNITLVSGGNPYTLNYSLPVGKWSDVSLIGKGNKTFLSVDGGEKMEFLARLGVNGEYSVWAPIAIEAPVQRIGEGFVGMMGEVKLWGSAR
ncbi:beta-hexosaminidase [Aspergillus vadensis CBS 113365]|uniref:beta-N-acetylhexosaminidase n=1 Tax=Aspergillus vadensis (strain CBS 113365 / IMI 142717 / IBT 24658) TaxID=1448311 RepID=A0A319B1X0_ASPVC|nr:beta-hexosaminidase [Aspergillus vadensis CBS 113365]PYH66676.1 beta-hexosaminidase [Aspergillus vadensis CBS 113365]